ncbi:MAG: hypothetical protein ACTSYL_03835 [Candidatus Thorarchaeota archaeon]
MQHTESVRKILSVVAVTIFLISMLYASSATAVPTSAHSVDTPLFTWSQEKTPPPEPPAPMGANGTFVDWNRDSNSTSDQWSWENRNWLFGPKAKYEIYYKNGTMFGKDDYAVYGQWLVFAVTIPNNLFSKNATLSSVEIQGWYMSQNVNLSADFHLRYEIWGSSFSWNVYSSIWNGSCSNPDAPSPTFVELDSASSTTSHDVNSQHVNFVVRFNESAPEGLYSLDLLVFDNEGNSFGLGDYGTGWQFRGISVGIPPSEAWTFSFGGTYTLQKLSLTGDTIYSVSRNGDFIMRFNVTGENTGIVRLSLPLPDGMNTKVNETSWYRVPVTTTGGWEYDPTLHTFVWNASAEVTTYKEEYGVHEVDQWVPFNTWREINVTRLSWEWNETTQRDDPVLYEETQWAPALLIFTYNVTSDTWSDTYGYSVWGYPYDHYNPDQPGETEFIIPDTYPPNLPVFYELNYSLCTATEINHQLVVDFVGHFTEDMPPTSNDNIVRFETSVLGSDGNPYGPATCGNQPLQSDSDFRLAQQVAIESPVTVARLLTADGRTPMGWLFQVDKNKDFMIKGELQGGSDIASDIDGVKVDFNAYTGTWSENESIWTDISYRIYYTMNGTPTFSAFNYTTKYNQTYGKYWDYMPVNKTGWYKDYNSTTGTWEYKFGNYTIWEWGETEGWYWTTWYYNQQTHQWQHEWIPTQGPETRITSSVFCTTSNYTTWTENGNLYVSFLINMSDSVPDQSYDWSFAFTNNTWYEDTTSSWGLHEVYSWEFKPVYSFDYLGTPVYVDKYPDSMGDNNQLAYQFTNKTGDTQLMLGQDSPYIVIDGRQLPITTIDTYDPAMGSTHKRILFFDRTDPFTGKDIYYYKLLNGTKIPVTSIDAIFIYNVTLYNGESFLTAQSWSRWWNGNGTESYYWIDINGGVHQGDWQYDSWNAQIEFYDYIEFTGMPISQFVRYGGSGFLNITAYWWDSGEETYYLTDTNGTLYRLQYESSSGRYMIFIDGAWQYVSYPEQYFVGDYNNKPAILLTCCLDQFWFYEDGNGVRHEMPYPKAGACSSYDLDHIQPDGRVPSTKSLIYNGTAYPIMGEDMNMTTTIDGVTYGVTEVYAQVIVANGTISWNPLLVGSTTQIGTFTGEQVFEPVETIRYYTDTAGEPFWDGNYTYYHLFNDTVWKTSDTYLVTVYAVSLNGSEFYSWFNYPYSWYHDNYTEYYYWAINGTKIQLRDYDILPVINVTMVEAYDDGSGLAIDFKGQTYKLHDNAFYTWTRKILNATSSTPMYIQPWEHYPIYNFTYKGVNVTAFANTTPIRSFVYVWGYQYVYGPHEIESTVYYNFRSFVIGSPRWGMWGLRNWATDPSNGALDLDGNFDTTDDQYYVLEAYDSTDQWNHTWDHMDVWLTWDPNGTQYGDEMRINSWMGIDTFSWSYSWNQSFFWYHADDLSQVNSTEMATINETLFTSGGEPRAGYWDIAWMAKNVTWEDILAEAKANGWDWYDEDGQTWTWLSFGIDQNYGTSTQVGDVTHWLNVGLHYEYSGLMIWEDNNTDGVMSVNVNDPSSSELTHFLIPDSIGSISFVTPGEGYGNNNASGFLALNLTDEVTWGVAFHDVNGTVFPFTSYGYWGWYDSLVTGTDMRTFDERPTKVTIDELSFLVHFHGNVSDTSLNNEAIIKVDNYVGNWDVDLLGGRDNLANRSLALNYFSEVRMSDFAFKANGTFADSESTVSADRFQLETSGAQFAEMIMGGVTYDWGKNKTAPYDVLSYTTPLGTFRTAFESDSGQSAAAWSFSSSMYMVSIGFPKWDGYSVNQDPVFVSYVSASGVQGGLGPVTFGAFSIEPDVPTSSDSVTVRGDIYTSEQINEVSLHYSTDGTNWESNSMWNENGNTWAGTIPPFDEGTQVYFKVVVSTPSGTYESDVQSYVVGQGIITITTTTLPYTGGGPEISTEVLFMVGGIAVVVIVLAVIVSKRRR